MQGSKSGAEPEIPQDVHLIDSVPHDWLFPRMDAVMHHGGAGVGTFKSLCLRVERLIMNTSIRPLRHLCLQVFRP